MDRQVYAYLTTLQENGSVITCKDGTDIPYVHCVAIQTEAGKTLLKQQL